MVLPGVPKFGFNPKTPTIGLRNDDSPSLSPCCKQKFDVRAVFGFFQKVTILTLEGYISGTKSRTEKLRTILESPGKWLTGEKRILKIQGLVWEIFHLLQNVELWKSMSSDQTEIFIASQAYPKVTLYQKSQWPKDIHQRYKQKCTENLNFWQF